MKVIGLLGGMSWASTAHYYRLLNEGVNARLGGLHSASLILHSVDFEPIARMQSEGRWDDAASVLGDAAAGLERAGADVVLLCTNTMHRVFEALEARVAIPMLHIADATATAAKRAGIQRLGLLGTRFTMEAPFYRERLRARHGIDVIVPSEADRAVVHRVIYDELCHGVVSASSRDAYVKIVTSLVDAGAEGVVFGCTEIMMLLRQEDVSVNAFDTTALHVAAALEFALEG